MEYKTIPLSEYEELIALRGLFWLVAEIKEALDFERPTVLQSVLANELISKMNGINPQWRKLALDFVELRNSSRRPTVEKNNPELPSGSVSDQMLTDMHVTALTGLYRNINEIITSMSPRERRRIEEMEVIFVDKVNGAPVGKVAYSFKDVIDAIQLGGKPIGILIGDITPREAKRFPDLTVKEEEILMSMLAEAQDEEEDFKIT